MRLFKFFFAVSLAIMAFFFIARVVVVAVMMAAVMSLVFFMGRKIKSFFRNMDWRDESDYQAAFGNNRAQGLMPAFAYDQVISLDQATRSNQYAARSIQIR